jgi:hypothetical protein
MLAADTPDEFLQAAVRQVVDQLLPAADENWDLIGTRIGRYLITGLIGKGGVGGVYRAVRTDDFQMQVALKLLKRGSQADRLGHLYSRTTILITAAEVRRYTACLRSTYALLMEWGVCFV